MLNVTNIEVIRNSNPGSLQVAPPGELELTYGDTLRITTEFEYRSPSDIDITLVGRLGQVLWPTGRFDPIITAEAPSIELPAAAESTPATAVVDIPITADISPGSNYDIQCQIKEHPEASDEVDDVITITGMPPTFELLEETIYPYAYVYDGDAEVSTFTFKTDPFTPADWIAGILASHVEAEVKKAGGRVMEMRVYIDKTPLLWTEWRIEVVGVPPAATAGVAMPLGITWWAVAILAALAIALIIVVTWSIKTIVSSFTHKPISPEIKAVWSKETLISAIGDFETKLEKTPTPPEDLEEMSADELREYCDQLAEEIVPPEISWLPVAVIGGLAVLGAGGAAAYALARPKE
ncbi:hypothetical protein ES706_06051 [subsurface metagenome]